MGLNKGFFFILCLLLILGGCTGLTERANRLALESGFEKSVIQGSGFRHVLYANRVAGNGKTLNVYIEGDGIAWVGGRFVAKNPTPRKPLMLQLMALDDAPAVYLGRPCYFGLHTDTGCDNKYWSSHRYSAEVVASMLAALNAFPEIESINLFGHSGGGTLAVLMAGRMPNVKTVVTVAGNLDTDAWTEKHGYQPLTGSLNPALQPPLPASIRQLHIAGGKDGNVPPELIHDFTQIQVRADFRRYPQQKHECCWQSVWREILAGLSTK